MSTGSKTSSPTSDRQATQTLPFRSYDLLTLEQAAAYLGPWCTVRWMRRQVYELKKIDSVKVGGRRLVPRSELDRIVAEGWVV